MWLLQSFWEADCLVSHCCNFSKTWLEILMNFTKCDCPWENLYKCSTNAFAFEQLKTSKNAGSFEKNEPSIRLHSCSHLGAFACVYCQSVLLQKCVWNERSEWVMCSKLMHIVSLSTNFVWNKWKCLKQSVYLKQTPNFTLINNCWSPNKIIWKWLQYSWLYCVNNPS